MTSLFLAMPVLFALTQASPADAKTVAPPVGPQTIPAISMFVGGNFGPGWWTLDIDEKGLFSPDASESAPRRRMTEPERQVLAGLLSSLPRDRPAYGFVGPTYVDATVEFRLTIGKGPSQRRYVVNDTFAGYGAHPEVKDVLRLMHFLRTLVESKGAHVPPSIETPSTK
jgi:hypothetical protein